MNPDPTMPIPMAISPLLVWALLPLGYPDAFPVLLGLAHRLRGVRRPASFGMRFAERAGHFPNVLRPATAATTDVGHAHVQCARGERAKLEASQTRRLEPIWKGRRSREPWDLVRAPVRDGLGGEEDVRRPAHLLDQGVGAFWIAHAVDSHDVDSGIGQLQSTLRSVKTDVVLIRIDTCTGVHVGT